jgi:hypothetical protein
MIKIYGASDDLVEIEGHPDGDEVNCYNHDVLVYIGDPTTGGLAIRMTYAPNVGEVDGESIGFGCWAAEVCQLAEDCPIPWPVTLTVQRRNSGEVGYSVCVNIDAPTGVPLAFKTVRSA